MPSSPRVLLANLAHKELSFLPFRSIRDTRPIGAVIQKLSEREREILSLLKSDDIKNDLLEYMIHYGYRWFPMKNFPACLGKDLSELKLDFDKERESYRLWRNQ